MAVSNLAPSACCSRSPATRRCIFSASGATSCGWMGGNRIGLGASDWLGVLTVARQNEQDFHTLQDLDAETDR